MIVTPWEVKADAAGVDYAKLVKHFGCSSLDSTLLDRFEKAIGRPLHHLIRRGIFFAHRDLQMIVYAKENGLPVYLYTGRGPSSKTLHVGHLVPFIINKWLQDVLDCPLVIQVTDDEKFLFKDNLELDVAHDMGWENIKDIIACGFDPEKTFIFRDIDYIHRLYPIVLKMQKKTTFNQVKGIFGFNDSTNIGCIAFPCVQAAPAVPAAFPEFLGNPAATKVMSCLIPCAIDQDPYFRMTRDLAPKMGFNKPSLILSEFIPSLQGATTKMSASNENTAIYVSDDPKEIKKKVNKYAFSGGRDTLEEQRTYGADLTMDISYQYLRVFMEDDQELARIGRDYKTGKLLTGEVKAILIETLSNILKKHQEARVNVTDDVVRQFCDPDRPQLREIIESRCKRFSEKIK